MPIRTVITRGYDTGSFTTTIALVTLRGYGAGAAAAAATLGAWWPVHRASRGGKGG